MAIKVKEEKRVCNVLEVSKQFAMNTFELDIITYPS